MDESHEEIGEVFEELLALLVERQKCGKDIKEFGVWFCHDMALCCSDNHLEGMGILEIASKELHDTFKRNNEEDFVCDDCRDKAKNDIEENLKEL